MSDAHDDEHTDHEDAWRSPVDLLPPRPAEPAELATWGRRVLATIIDDLLLAGVAYLAATGQQGIGAGVLSPAPVWGSDGGRGSTWLLGSFAVMLLLQGYVGSTPGKLVVGIAVVGEHDGRPVGLLRTVGRWVLHLIDAILFIGYLRPLWHPYRQTYADSLVRTLALRTRAPLPHPWLSREPVAPSAPGVATPLPRPDGAALPRPQWRAAPTGLLLNVAGPAPRWRRDATVVAAAVCLVGGAFAIGPVQGTSDDPRAWCDASGLTADSPADAPLRLTGASVGVWPGTWTERRLWVQRRYAMDQDAGVHVSWDWDGTVPAEPVTLRVTLRGEDGAPERVLDHVSRQGYIESGPGTPVGDLGSEVLLPLSVLDGLGDRWTWETTMLIDGEVVPGCGGPAPDLA